MKKSIFLFPLLFLICQFALAQTGGINFQGLARNASGEVLVNQKITLRFSVLLSSETGTTEYQESKEATTNAQGMFSLVIGEGSILTKTGNFLDINWKVSPKFLKVEMDPSAGANFTLMGTTKLQAVPFAYYANGVDAENVQGVLPAVKGGTGVASITALKGAMQLDQVSNTSDTNKPLSAATQTALGTKVDKIQGKDLSTNDYTTAEKTKLAAITGTNTGDQDLSGFATTADLNSKANAADVTTALATKVDKVQGKELSTNDYTTAEKTKLAAITGTNTGYQDLSGYATTADLNSKANAADVTTALATKVDKVQGKELSTNDYTTAEKTKLAAITGTNTGDQDLTGYATTADLNSKANTSDVTTTLATKVDKVQGKELSTNDFTTAEKIKLAAITGTNTGDQDLSGYATTADLATIILPITNGGTGSAIQNFVDLNADQTIEGQKTFVSNVTVNGVSLGTGLSRTISNTGVGLNALGSSTTGINNTALGANSLAANITGDGNTALGSGANVGVDNLENATAIGYNAVVGLSNTIQLGNSSVTNVVTAGTITAGAVTYPKVHGASGQVLTTTGAGELGWSTPAAGFPAPSNTQGDIPFSDGSVNFQSNSAFSWDNEKGSLNIITKNNSSFNPSLRVRPNPDNSSMPTWMRMGDDGVGAEFGISGGNDQFFEGTVQGDAVIKGFSSNNDKKIFIGATLNNKANMVMNPDGSTFINGILQAGGITYPTTFGTSGQVLTSNGAGLATWSNSGLNNFVESNYSYDGKNGVALKANRANQTNLDLVLSSRGIGAILASQPDGTALGGNNRGIYAIDLQVGRSLNTEVASGDFAFIGSGANNTSSAQFSFVGGGLSNQATATKSAVVAGFRNSAINVLSFVGGGELNTASGTYSSVFGGFNNIASGHSSVSGGYSNVASGDFSFTSGGLDNVAQSFGETVLGFRATVEAGDANQIIPTDRLFTIGNGVTPTSRSNAITILKNANTTIGGALTINANSTNSSLTLPINRGDSGQVLTTDGAGLTTWTNSSNFYSIGDFAHGGIVFWVDESGQHGLVCAKMDQSSGVRWDAGSSSYTMALGDGPLAGKMNTAIIIATTGRGDGNTYASRICNELKITEMGKTYGDWYLPSKEELNLIYINRALINSTATANGGTALIANGIYSSSTESHWDRSGTIWGQFFSDGFQDERISKALTCNLRAIRSF